MITGRGKNLRFLRAWIIGVQWHPELEWTVELFEAFVEEARRAREERDREAGRP